MTHGSIASNRARFAEAEVARLATADAEGLPHIVPITFALLEANRIVTAIDDKPKTTTNLRRLRNIQDNPRVAVLVDHYDPDWRKLWWVRADGEAELLESGEQYQLAIDALTGKYPQYRRARLVGPAIVITVDTWTGWSHSP
jgi:PPOX class probable F420-dependent enzyme